MPTRLPRIATAVLAGSLALGVASPALAEETTDDPTLAERCLDQIDRRIGDLGTAKSRAQNATALTDSHLGTITSIIDSTEAGLGELAVAIEATDDRATLVELCTSIATDHRVYLVVLPQTHLAIGADRVEAATDRGDELIATFDAAVDAAIQAGADVTEAVALRNDAAVQAGADVTEAVALRNDAAAHLADAATTAAGVGDQVLTVTPSSWNDGPGQTVIQDSRTAVRSGHEDIKAGIQDGKAAIEALRAAIDAVGSDA